MSTKKQRRSENFKDRKKKKSTRIVYLAAIIGGASLFGGVGGILGVLLGAAITQMLNNGLILLGYPSYWQTAAICTLMLVTFMLDYWRRQRQAAVHGTSD